MKMDQQREENEPVDNNDYNDKIALLTYENEQLRESLKLALDKISTMEEERNSVEVKIKKKFDQFKISIETKDKELLDSKNENEELKNALSDLELAKNLEIEQYKNTISSLKIELNKLQELQVPLEVQLETYAKDFAEERQSRVELNDVKLKLEEQVKHLQLQLEVYNAATPTTTTTSSNNNRNNNRGDNDDISQNFFPRVDLTSIITPSTPPPTTMMAAFKTPSPNLNRSNSTNLKSQPNNNNNNNNNHNHHLQTPIYPRRNDPASNGANNNDEYSNLYRQFNPNLQPSPSIYKRHSPSPDGYHDNNQQQQQTIRPTIFYETTPNYSNANEKRSSFAEMRQESLSTSALPTANHPSSYQCPMCAFNTDNLDQIHNHVNFIHK